jgi:hypothetical protein
VLLLPEGVEKPTTFYNWLQYLLWAAPTYMLFVNSYASNIYLTSVIDASRETDQSDLLMFYFEHELEGKDEYKAPEWALKVR